MKTFRIFFALLLILFCLANSQTQFELDSMARLSFNKTDNEMCKIYNEICTKFKNDTIFIKKLETAQKAWGEYRTAQIESVFPKPIPKPNYKDKTENITTICFYSILERTTRNRMEELKELLEKDNHVECIHNLPKNKLKH
jgi:uncharacterized protein YecT (DUF1311 family)